MSHLPKPNQSSLPPLKNNLVPQDADADQLLVYTEEILRREVQNLLYESSRGKLNAGSARDLVNYVKLMHELKMEKAKALAEMSDEELAKLAKP